jgi:colicin import membrane protein
MADDKKHAEPDGDEIDFSKMAEGFKKMAEEDKEKAKKEMYMAASNHFSKQAEAKKEAEAAKEAEAKKEAEDKAKAEADKGDSEKKEEAQKVEAEYKSKYVNLKKETLMSEAGLSSEQKAFVGNLLETELDEKKIEKVIKDYAAVSLKEAAQRKSHNFEKRIHTQAENKKSLSDRMADALA